MRVICLQDSWSFDHDAILVKKGCEYHVIDVSEREEIIDNSNIWYQLLETKDSLHSSTLFAIAPNQNKDIAEIAETQYQKD